MKHAINRTSPKGPGKKFIGTCMNCGKTGLTLADFSADDCENIVGRSEEESVLAAIAGKDVAHEDE